MLHKLPSWSKMCFCDMRGKNLNLFKGSRCDDVRLPVFPKQLSCGGDPGSPVTSTVLRLSLVLTCRWRRKM